MPRGLCPEWEMKVQNIDIDIRNAIWEKLVDVKSSIFWSLPQSVQQPDST